MRSFVVIAEIRDRQLIGIGILETELACAEADRVRIVSYGLIYTSTLF